MLIVGSRFAVCVGSPEPAAPADAGVGDFEEEPEDPAEVAEDVVDGVLADSCGLICAGDGPSAGSSPEMDEVAGGRTALAFGAGSAVAVGLASEPSLAAAVGRAKSGATDGSPCGFIFEELVGNEPIQAGSVDSRQPSLSTFQQLASYNGASFC